MREVVPYLQKGLPHNPIISYVIEFSLPGVNPTPPVPAPFVHLVNNPIQGHFFPSLGITQWLRDHYLMLIHRLFSRCLPESLRHDDLVSQLKIRISMIIDKTHEMSTKPLSSEY